MKSNEFLKIFKRDGWVVMRINGSHHIMAHPTKKIVGSPDNTISVPVHGSKEIGKGLGYKLLKAAGIKNVKL